MIFTTFHVCGCVVFQAYGVQEIVHSQLLGKDVILLDYRVKIRPMLTPSPATCDQQTTYESKKKLGNEKKYDASGEQTFQTRTCCMTSCVFRVSFLRRCL